MTRKCLDCQRERVLCRYHKLVLRCRSCAAKFRWANGDDQCRKFLREWNVRKRAGYMPYRSREWIRYRYEDLKMSAVKIAEEGKCGISTIDRWLRTHDIPVRDQITATRIGSLRGTDHPNWEGAKYRICSKCSGEKAPGAIVCKKCRTPLKGAAHPKWRGIANIKKLVRQWSDDNWHPLIYRRDEYCCVKCGDNHGGNLNAHHIVTLTTIIRHFLKEKGLDPKTMSSEERVRTAYEICSDSRIRDLNNGMTLCEVCHKDVHRSSGNAKNYRTVLR